MVIFLSKMAKFSLRKVTTVSNDKVSITNDATGAMSFYSDAQFNFFESDNMTNAVTINANAGRLGVGVTGPSEKLDVAGTARLRGLQAGDLATDELVVADTDGVLKTVAASALGGEWEDDGAMVNVPYRRMLQAMMWW